MNQDERIRLERNFYIIGLCIPFVGAVLFWLKCVIPAEILTKLMFPCVFYVVTGLYCPGCGGTRALKALLEGKILLSFCYHPVVAYCAALYLWFMISHTIEYLSGHRWNIGMRYRNLYLYLTLVIIIINTAVKDIALTAFHTDLLKLLECSQALV